MDQRQASPTHSQPKPKTKSKRYLMRMGRVLIYGLFGLIITVLLAFSAAAIFVYQNPQAIAQAFTEQIKKHINIQASFETINIALFPMPAVALSNIHMEHEDIKLSVAYATARPSVLALLQGEFALGYVNLLRPQISGKITQTQDLAQPTPSTNPVEPQNITKTLHDILATIPIPSLLKGSDLNIMHGSLNMDVGTQKIVIDDLQAEIDISHSNIINANINLGASSLTDMNGPLAKVDALQLNISGLTKPNKLDALTLTLNARMHIADILQGLDVNLNMALIPSGNFAAQAQQVEHNLRGSWDVKGDILWHNFPINFSTNGNLEGSLESSITLNNVMTQLGNDKLVLQAKLENIFTASPNVSGSIKLERLNLTQWFGFARNFPPGLQQTLQGITDGTLNFNITENGLEVPYVEASTIGTTFKGTGGVANWNDIIIKLDLAGESLSLVQAFPETEGVPAFAPNFPHPPLTPIPGTPEAAQASGPSVGYDINLKVEKLTTWGLTLQGVSFKCIPTEQDEKSNPKNHPNAVLLDFDIEKFYGGKGKAKAILFRTKEQKSGYDITAVLRNVKAQGPLSILAGREIFGGRLSLDTSFIAYGKNLGEFLISKVGELTFSSEDGFFTSKSKERTSFEHFKVAGKFTSKPLTTKMVNKMPEVLRYNGIWRMELQRPDMHFESNLNGILTLVGRNYTDLILDKTSGQLQATLSTKLTGLKHDILADIGGKYSFNSVKSTFGIDEAQMIAPNFANTALNGNFKLNYAKELEWEANLKGKTERFSVFADKLSTDVAKSSHQTLDIQAKISKKAKELHISNLQLDLGKTKITGNIHKTEAQKPLWNVNLKLNLLDWDSLFPPEKAKQTKDDDTAKEPWSLAWLKENDAKGQIHIDILRLHKTTSTNVRIPINMQNNTLILSPITGTFYGGKAKVDFVGKGLGNVLQVQGGLSAENVNMLQLSHELQLDTAIGGKGSIWASMQGALNNSSTILPLLDGTWRVKILDGFFQTREKDGTLSGERTIISELQDTGPLSNGIIYSKNLIIKGPTLSLTGSGQINMVKDTLDMNLLVTTSGFENIPVRYHGNLSDPQQDIHTGAVIVGAITNLGTGIFDILGGALEGFFKLFQ